MIPFKNKGSRSKQATWTIDHLQEIEPAALEYLHHDDWDGSSLSSTPSFRVKLDSPTSILRNGGEPSAIIVSVKTTNADSPKKRKKLLEKLLRALAMLIYFWKKEKTKSRTDSEMDLDIGPTAVIV